MTSPPAASRAAGLARLMLTYAPRWHVTTTIPGTGPRILTATELGTGRRIHARSEPELEAHLTREAAPASAEAAFPAQHVRLSVNTTEKSSGS